MASFSERQGLKTRRDVDLTKRAECSATFRNFIADSVKRWGLPVEDLRAVTWRLAKDDIAIDKINHYFYFRAALRRLHWFEVYDFIEALHEAFAENDVGDSFMAVGPSKAPGFASDINDFLLGDGIPWQLVNGEITTRGSDAFEETVGTAIPFLEQSEQPTGAGYLRFAVAALSARPNANTGGAVTHATNAVECVLGEITGQAMTLGSYLDKCPALFHPALKKGLNGIYGYASDEGARHGKEGIEPTGEAAEFIVATCAALCTLLTRRRSGEQK